jgi:hypothetical protein
MRPKLRLLGASLCAVAVCWADPGVATAQAASTPLPDSDTAVVSFALEVVPSVPPVSFPTPATFSLSGQCGQISPAPGGPAINLPVTFVDIPSDEGTTCGSLSGGGSFTAAGCTAGVGSGSATLTEPSGDAVPLSGLTLILSGTAVLLEAGYQEPGSSAGVIVGAGIAVPALGTTCLGGLSQYQVTMVLSGAYLGGS